MFSKSIETEMPIITLSVNFERVELKIDNQNINALLRSTDFDKNTASQIEYLKKIFETAFSEAKLTYGNILSEIYEGIAAEETTQISRSMEFHILDDEGDEQNED